MKTHLALLAVVGAGAVGGRVAAVLGQVTTAIPPGLADWVGNIGIVGVLIWHLYYSSQAMPKMLDAFSKEAAAQREANRVDREAERESNRVQREADRAMFRQEQEALRSHSSKETAELRGMLIRSFEEGRRAVHDMRDTAQQVVNQVAAKQIATGGS